MALYINGQLYLDDGITRSTSDYAIYVPSGKSVDFYIGGSKVMDMSNDGAKTTLIGLSGDYWQFGTQATDTSYSLNSENDVFIVGELEVGGASFFDGNLTIAADAIFNDDKSLRFGSGTGETRIRYQIADANAKCLAFMMDESDDSGNNVPAWVFGEETNLFGADLGLLDEVVQPHIVVLENSGQIVSITNASSSGASVTLTTATGNTFDNAAIGDIVRVVSGTNATPGWYWIDVATDGTNINLDRNWCSGAVSSDGVVQVWHKVGMVTPKAIYMPIYDGAPSDSDIDIDMDGATALDVKNSRFYWRASNGWHYAAQDAGFEVNKDDKHCPVCSDLLEPGQAVVGQIDRVLEDGARHGEWCHLTCLN